MTENNSWWRLTVILQSFYGHFWSKFYLKTSKNERVKYFFSPLYHFKMQYLISFWNSFNTFFDIFNENYIVFNLYWIKIIEWWNEYIAYNMAHIIWVNIEPRDLFLDHFKMRPVYDYVEMKDCSYVISDTEPFSKTISEYILYHFKDLQ